MDICGEHGDEIAHSGRDCPACEHVEKVTADLREEYESQLVEKDQEISDLSTELEEEREKNNG